MKKQIPNLFTLLNLLFGCMAIVATLQNGIVIGRNSEDIQLVEMPEKIWLASLFIGIAALVDFLDGMVARIFNATSEMGKQLDSLADVVSFGVAPSMSIYQFLRLSYASQENGLEVSVLFLLPAFFIALAAAYRLAKFNIDHSQQFYFKGVPTPATGLLFASFPLIYWYTDQSIVYDCLFNKWVLYAIVFFTSSLMISNIPMMSMKIKQKGIVDNMEKIVLIGLSLGLVFFLHWISVPFIFICYVLLSFIFRKKISK